MHSVSADNAENQSTSEISQKNNREVLKGFENIANMITHVAYAILRPLVALAGLASDNQLIYGSPIGLDTMLWKIWQITRTFANYALGLIFLICILFYSLSPEGKMSWKGGLKINNPKDLIKKTLLAGVVIQASWFILMALVDISTVLTYSVGAIPTSLLSSQDVGNDEKMLVMHTNRNISDKDIFSSGSRDKLTTLYWSDKLWESKNKKDEKEKKSEKDKDTATYIAPCETVENNNSSGTLIIGRQFDTVPNGQPAATGFCMYYGTLVAFVDFTEIKVGDEVSGCSKDNGCPSYEKRLNIFSNNMKKSSTGNLMQYTKLGIILPLGKVDTEGQSKNNQEKVITMSTPLSNQECIDSAKIGEKGARFIDPRGERSKDTGYQQLSGCIYDKVKVSISSMMDNGMGLMGAFASLYKSINFFPTIKSTTNLFGRVLESVINLLFVLLLVLPLVALVCVLFARVGILWMAIAVSPFIALLKVFEIKNPLFSFLDIDNLKKLLFAPVLFAFAVSLSLVMMINLKYTLPGNESHWIEDITTGSFLSDKIHQDKIWNVNGNTLSVLDGIIDIEFSGVWINFSWFIVMIFGLGITWFLLFWAIKRTRVGEEIGGKFQGLGHNLIGNMPIIPTPAGAVGINAAMSIPNKLESKFAGKLQNQNNKIMDKLFDGKNETTSGISGWNSSIHSYHNNEAVNKGLKNLFVNTSTMLPQSRNSHFLEAGIDIIKGKAGEVNEQLKAGDILKSLPEQAKRIKEVTDKGVNILDMNALKINEDVQKDIELLLQGAEKDKYDPQRDINNDKSSILNHILGKINNKEFENVNKEIDIIKLTGFNKTFVSILKKMITDNISNKNTSLKDKIQIFSKLKNDLKEKGFGYDETNSDGKKQWENLGIYDKLNGYISKMIDAKEVEENDKNAKEFFAMIECMAPEKKS